MLEGLEITEIKLEDLKNENWTFRIDSEFQKKEYLRNIDLIKRCHTGSFKLKDAIRHMTGGATPLGAEYLNSGIPFLRVQNIMQNYFSLNDVVYISKSQNDELKRSTLKLKDVLLTITGVSYGKSATVTKSIEGSNINQHSVKISLNSRLNPYFLSTFLNSTIGKLQSDKNIVGVTRPALDYQVIRNFNIPNVQKNFQDKIEELILLSERTVSISEAKYKSAETLLLQTLGLQDFSACSDAVNIKGFKESFLCSGRLDAEYYQKKYEEITARITEHKYDQLGSLVKISKSVEPGSEAYQEEGIPFIRVSNLTKMGLSEPDIHLDKSEFKNVIRPKKDTILLSKDGTVGIAYKVPEDMFAITSGAILHLNVKSADVLPDYLTLVLNSIVVQMQAERDAGGSILQHWKPSEIEQVEIPIVDKTIQEQIAALVQESFRLKKESEQLLELAKRAVEIAIEEGEERAMEMIENKILC
ncbi:MAG: restriction endonuclease subunit S [Paludibacter sp.]|nr:restriction endonuclease subunit S [Paludibacter sp.]